ncbi:MAG: hypothetical protein AB8B67_03720 [Rickettsiaceae bacterium]
MHSHLANTNVIELLNCIVETDMQFDISNDQLQSLFSYHGISGSAKRHEDLTKILLSFGLNANSEIYPRQKIAQILIQNSSELRLEKTLKFLHKQKLLPQPLQYQDRSHQPIELSIILDISRNANLG